MKNTQKLDRWGLDIPTSITVAHDTDYSTLVALRLHRSIKIDTNPRSRAIHTIELSRVGTLGCVCPKGRPCRGIDMVRRFNSERSYGERITKGAAIALGFEDKFDLRRYTPIDARISRRLPVEGIFDHLMSTLGIPHYMERYVRFFMDGSLLTSPSGVTSWTLYAHKTADKDGHPIYACERWPADLERGKHDYSLVLI
jgi:hypothetical protein